MISLFLLLARLLPSLGCGCFFVFVFLRGFILRAELILRGLGHNRLERFIWIFLFIFLTFFFLSFFWDLVWSGVLLVSAGDGFGLFLDLDLDLLVMMYKRT